MLLILLLLGSLMRPTVQAGPWVEWPVLAGPDDQENPDLHGTMVVWQEFVSEFGDYDVYVVDINDIANPQVTAIGDANDQMHPAVYGRRVVWQDLIVAEDSADWDIRMADFSDFDEPIGYVVSEIPANNEERPAIYGNTVVWQDTSDADYDVFGADVTDPERPAEFAIAAFEADQQQPSIWRTTVVWEDSFFGDKDIVAAGISDQNDVSEFAVISAEGQQRHPDIDGHLVVWQDDRDGNWDIFGYNLVTREIFRISDDPGDQIHPAVSGNTVIWQDDRLGPWNIYAAILDGPAVAGCAAPPAGDLDGDCRVDFADMAILAGAWLESHLDEFRGPGIENAEKGPKGWEGRPKERPVDRTRLNGSTRNRGTTRELAG